MKAHFGGHLKAILAIVGNFLGQRRPARRACLSRRSTARANSRAASVRRWAGVSSDAGRWWFIMGWGVRRIVGELRKLALTPSRGSVRRVLEAEGVLPDPDRHAPKGVETTWRKFLAAHLDCMMATDFFCKSVWTPTGRHWAYVLLFIHLGSRKVFVSSSAYHPDADWIQQQARNVTMWAEDEGLELRFLIRDHDSKFTEAFDGHFRRVSGERIVKTPVQSPIANSFAESWIGSLKRECLNAFYCFSLRQVDHVVQTYARYHNTMRPHQSLGNVPLNNRDGPEEAVAGSIGPVRRTRLLGGLLNHYAREAA